MDRDTFATLTVIATVAVVAPLVSEWLKGRIPGVVLEIALGIVVGPQLLGLAKVTPLIDGLSGIGLTFLFFMAGYEIDMQRIRGRPLALATAGWFGSLALGFALVATLVITGFALSTLLIGLALTTTALGTLLPMLEDNGEMHTPFGAFVLAIGGAGEFLPIVAITVLLSGHNPFGSCSVWVASRLGLDVLLGAFAAGLVVRLANQGENAAVIDTKLSALVFGLFVPVFFVVSGISFDLDALTHSPATLLRVPVFLALFLVVRGLPTLVSHRRVLGPSDRLAAALLASTALPVVVAITKIGLDRNDMKPENAAALIAAGMLSVLVFPAVAFGLRRRSARTVDPAVVPDGE